MNWHLIYSKKKIAKSKWRKAKKEMLEWAHVYLLLAKIAVLGWIDCYLLISLCCLSQSHLPSRGKPTKNGSLHISLSFKLCSLYHIAIAEPHEHPCTNPCFSLEHTHSWTVSLFCLSVLLGVPLYQVVTTEQTFGVCFWCVLVSSWSHVITTLFEIGALQM